MRSSLFTRRRALAGVSAVATAVTFPSYAWDAQESVRNPQVPGSRSGTATEQSIQLVIDSFPLTVNGRTGNAIAVNGAIPGPVVRLREGQDVTIRVENRLSEVTSIHWHGILLPNNMDGVPGVVFGGIPAHGTFTYRFPVQQSGTYWAHSHSGGQEFLGLYFPLLIDPREPEPFSYDREYVVMLSDWSFESPERVLAKLKKQSGYYNFQRRTVGTFFSDVSRNGLSATVKERLSWSKMRMDPTDYADVTGFTETYLLNGQAPKSNWTGLFRPGERVRLRFIDAGANTFFDVRIPGLKMTVVAADGQPVQPVEVDEFRFGPGETYDILVQPEDRAYTLFAEALDRSGYTCGTLAPRAGMSAAVPPLRPRPVRTMADMGMDMSCTGNMSGMKGMVSPPEPRTTTTKPSGMSADHDMSSRAADMSTAGGQGVRKKSAEMAGMDTTGHSMHGMEGAEQNRKQTADQRRNSMVGMNMGGMKMDVRTSANTLLGPSLPGSPALLHGKDTHGAGNSSTAMAECNRLNDPGSGFEESAGKVLTYADLRSLTSWPDQREPTREIELHITGNMDRYMWSFDGKKYSEASEPIPFHYGERLRLILVNDTMMEHPIHLHGMWMYLENGAGANLPRKHTIAVKPAERVSLAITPDVPGRWVLHCHLLLHMEMGMFRVVEVISGIGHA